MNATATDRDLHVLVLAGGGGTRLWPLSRAQRPKFLVDVGTGEPLLLDAVRRALAVTAAERVHIVTTVRHLAPTLSLTAPLGVTSVICEPEGRDTCAAAALGTAMVAHRDPEARIVSMPADQIAANDDTWRRAVHVLASATDGTLACLGIRPTRPETGFGYLRAPGADARPGTPCAVTSVHEKPDPATARSYLAGGQHLWNSGIMAWRADVFAAMLRTHVPAVAEAARAVSASGRGAAGVWRQAPRVPIEPALLAPAAASGALVVVPVDMSWNDLGTWTAVADLAATREARASRQLAHRSHNSSVTVTRDGSRRYVFVGADDLVLVDCEDVVMVVHRDAIQEVKSVVAELAAHGWADLM
ncbi:mannose-1-phosphate guanylyltransferase [Micromonospora globbae]|uniref:mannose-1-phosphate guanylyltransferase n=1 Tax=Micromonospora globbae TaxID=1894969 RepID=UPI003868AEA4|nr:sugar phosphate nucleotidyltransferase [Micromonospora globbae]